ncbi:MAG: hypothetical protein AAFP22_02180, partial [Planctomycetota bacterium]
QSMQSAGSESQSPQGQQEQQEQQGQQGQEGQQGQQGQQSQQGQQGQESPQSPQQQSRAETARAQAEAADALEDAARAAQSGAQPRTPEQQQRAEELRQRQEAVEKELLELARRNQQRDGLDQERTNQAMQRAAESAGEAEEALERGDLDEAEAEERETEQAIEEARSALEEEEDQYESLRQEELLFRIAEEVRDVRVLHEIQARALTELDAGRKKSKPTRSERIQLGNIAREEEALGGRIDGLVEAIRAEGSLVFAEVLDRASRDLARVARELSRGGGYDSGPRTQALQEDVTVALVELEEALRNELERRSEEEQQQQEGEQPQQKPKLVPDVAELKMLASMEEALQARVQLLFELHPEIAEGGELNSLVRRDITRLASQSERISTLFSAMRERLGITEEGEAPVETGEGNDEGDDR